MSPIRALAFLSLFGAACAACAAAAPPPAAPAEVAPAAIASDPPPDAANPPRMRPVLIPSGDVTMNGIVYLASGAGPHPTVLLLHGFPGNEQNLDLAQAIRRAGWNVLTLHYRGSWGSPGAFSFAGAIADTRAALGFLRDPARLADLRIDPARLAVIGHSMGGFMAAIVGADDPALVGVGMLAAWNIGADIGATPEAERAEAAEDMRPSTIPLAGCTAEGLLAEAIAHAAEWNFVARAAALRARPVLLVTADDGLADESHALGRALRAGGAPALTELHLATDHAFSDRRVALQAAVLRWLAPLAAVASSPPLPR